VISSTLLQTFSASHPADARVLRTRFGGKEIFVGCCVTGIELGRPLLRPQYTGSVLERCGSLEGVGAAELLAARAA